MATEKVLTRGDIEALIKAKRAQVERLPVHWEKRRAEIMADVEALVDDWLHTTP